MVDSCGAPSLEAKIPRNSCTREFVGIHIQTELRKLQLKHHICEIEEGIGLEAWEQRKPDERKKSDSVYDKVPRPIATARGIKLTSARWVDVNKEDETKYNVRCILVGNEMKTLAPELFSAMPLCETVKSMNDWRKLLHSESMQLAKVNLALFMHTERNSRRAQWITLAKCWRRSPKFMKVTDSGSENIVTRQWLLLTAGQK